MGRKSGVSPWVLLAILVVGALLASAACHSTPPTPIPTPAYHDVAEVLSAFRAYLDGPDAKAGNLLPTVLKQQETEIMRNAKVWREGQGWVVSSAISENFSGFVKHIFLEWRVSDPDLVVTFLGLSVEMTSPPIFGLSVMRSPAIF